MKITLEVQDVSKDLILKTHRGSGKYGDIPINSSTAEPDGSPVVKVGDKTYLVKTADIVKEIAKQHEKGGKS